MERYRDNIRKHIKAGCPERRKAGQIVLTADIELSMDPNSEEDIKLYQEAFGFETKEEVKELFEIANTNGCIRND